MTMSLLQIDEYINALCSNATELLKEAEVLFGVGSFARAHALAHFAREEFAKASILMAAGVRILARAPIDWKRLNKRLSSHKSKLMAETIQDALLLKGVGEKKNSHALLAGGAVAVVDVRNDFKNDSLYVDFRLGKVTRPASTISKEHASRTIAVARERCDEMDFHRRRVGLFAERKIGSVDFSGFDFSSPHAINLAALLTAHIHAMRLKEAAEDKTRD